MKRMSRNVKNKIPLIEASISAVLLVIAAIFITTAYVKADSLKGEAEKLSQAAIRCEDTAEKLKICTPANRDGEYQTLFGAFKITEAESEVYRVSYDKEWNVTQSEPRYELKITASCEHGDKVSIVRYNVSISEDGEVIAELPSYIVPEIGE